MKKLLTLITMLAMLNTASCSEKNKDTNSPAPSVSESSEDKGKTVLTVATTVDLSKVKNEILKKMSCDVDIKYYPYSEETDPFELLYLDMISGETPDVVYSKTDDIIKLINKNHMADMYPLMEQSETLKKEDFLPNILAGMEIDGKLPAICNEWQLLTAVAKTENVGEDMENWTPAQAWDTYKNMPEDMTFLSYAHFEYDELNYFMHRVSVDAVDYKNNTCDFGGAFMEMLGNVNNLPPFQPNKSFESDDLIKNRSLVSEVRFFGVNHTIAQQLYSEFGGADITFVGYPSETGKGYVTDAVSMMGIIETSQHKQQGYEFISLMLNNNLINEGMKYSMPVTEQQLSEKLNESKYNSSSINCPQYLPGGEEQIQMSEEAIKQVVDYIRNVEFEPYTSDTVDSIIFEEYRRCFKGETTPQECADMLDNRVSIYLSESE